jgi:hypothetical protein
MRRQGINGAAMQMPTRSVSFTKYHDKKKSGTYHGDNKRQTKDDSLKDFIATHGEPPFSKAHGIRLPFVDKRTEVLLRKVNSLPGAEN